MTRRQAALTLIGLLICSQAVLGQSGFDFPNHHLHNFAVSEHTYEHAVAMGYRLVPYNERLVREARPEFAQLGLIRNHNSHICPLRVHQRKSDGRLFVSYHSHAGATREGLSAVALAHGIRRKTYGSPIEMDKDDLFMLTGYGAAKRDVSELTLENLTYEEVQQSFYTSWPLENDRFKSCNVLCNWQSRRVVQEMLRSTLENIDWQRYDALFFDSLSGAAGHVTNASFGGQGSYASCLEGKLDFVRQVVEFVRDPARTGKERPYLVFTNIYDPRGPTKTKDWFAAGQLRLDHYYFEKGSKEEGNYLTKQGYTLGNQQANGVVPGTQTPAYVTRDNANDAPTYPYLPAHLVALDDAYAWSMRVSKKPNFDHEAFFAQHLDACGTAGIQGSWFGWYGEDYVDIRDVEGRLIYSNACQLLRAIPNWDNMCQIPAPPWNNYRDTDQRSWDGNIYRSPNSFASKEVIYSRHPDLHELFVVFRSRSGNVHLRDGEQIRSACFVNEWFSKTTHDAMPALQHDPQRNVLTLTDVSQRGRGLRIVVAQNTD